MKTLMSAANPQSSIKLRLSSTDQISQTYWPPSREQSQQVNNSRDLELRDCLRLLLSGGSARASTEERQASHSIFLSIPENIPHENPDADFRLPAVALQSAWKADKHDLWASNNETEDFEDPVRSFDEEELLTQVETLVLKEAVKQIETRGPVFTESSSLKDKEVLLSDDLSWLESFDNYVLEHLSDTTLSIPFLAEEFAMSESTLLRQLKRLTGLTSARYIQEIRLKKAWQLMKKKEYKSISQLAFRVGYKDPRSFSRIFKNRFGMLPSEVEM